MRSTQRAIAARPNNRGAIISRLLAAAAAVTLAMPLAAQDPSQQPMPTQPMPTQPTLNYASGQGARVSGWIISRRGNDLLVRDETTNQLSSVTVTQDTRIIEKAGV